MIESYFILSVLFFSFSLPVSSQHILGEVVSLSGTAFHCRLQLDAGDEQLTMTR